MTRTELAELFEAAHGIRQHIPRLALYAVLSLKIPCRIWSRLGWQKVCGIVYRCVTGKPLPGSDLPTFAMRNEYWGQLVGQALRKGATIGTNCDRSQSES